MSTEKQTLPKRGAILELTITASAFGGKGIAKINTENGDFVVFVPNTLPQQKVRVRIVKKSKKHAEGKLLAIVERSPLEVETQFQSIPGAPFGNYPIHLQHQEKKESTLELFKRIAHVEGVEDLVDEFIASPKEWHYRNKMEYSFSNLVFNEEKQEEYRGFGLGFKQRGQWRVVINMEQDSGLFDADLENSLKDIKLWCESTGLPPWKPLEATGFFRYLGVRKSYSTNSLLIELVTTSNDVESFSTDAFVALLQKLLPNKIEGILHTINDSTGDRSADVSATTRLIYGNDLLTEKLLDLDFEISMRSFFQTNPASAALLYQKVIDYVGEQNFSASDKVMDLFCGTGTIGQLIAKNTSAKLQVIGVDNVLSAIEDAKANAKRNEVENVEFICADVNKFLFQHPEYAQQIHTIVLDPPRAGIAPKALKRVIKLDAKTIVYVSCNPATQARDTVTLKDEGYRLEKLSIVDQFPHTAHIETIALFKK